MMLTIGPPAYRKGRATTPTTGHIITPSDAVNTTYSEGVVRQAGDLPSQILKSSLTRAVFDGGSWGLNPRENF